MPDESGVPDSESLIRPVLIGIGAVVLIALGQWVASAVLATSYGSIDLLTRLRRSLYRRRTASQELVAMSSITETGSSSGSQPAQKDDLVVERRPRQDTPDDSDEKQSGGIMGKYHAFMKRHPRLGAFIHKFGKDNIGMLAGYVSWSVLTSIVPLIVGLVAITGLFLRDPQSQQTVINHLAQASQGFSRKEIADIVHGSVRHSGILGLIGLVGVFWGGSNVGGAISTIFQAIFEVKGRSFIKEKLLDMGMIFVFAILMIVVVLGSTASALLSGVIATVPVPALAQAVGIAVTLIAAFLLFGAIYVAFPNIEPPFRVGNVWKGATVSAVLFTLLSQVWGIYANFQHFGKYGSAIASLLILTAWIYFFSLILVVGAEVVAFEAIQQAKAEGKEVGPQPEEGVPQHDVLRSDPAVG